MIGKEFMSYAADPESPIEPFYDIMAAKTPSFLHSGSVLGAVLLVTSRDRSYQSSGSFWMFRLFVSSSVG